MVLSLPCYQPLKSCRISIWMYLVAINLILLWWSLFGQIKRLESEGYYGGVRLLMALCKVFYKYCSDNNIELKKGNFTLSYDTNIPRQVNFFFIIIHLIDCLIDLEPTYIVLLDVDLMPTHNTQNKYVLSLHNQKYIFA